MLLRATVLVAILACVDVRAHEDTRFDLLESGHVEGAPPEYGIVQILREESTLEMCTASLVTLTVRFGEHVTHVPTALIEDRADSLEVLGAHGSWYHEDDPDGLPPYLGLELSSGRSVILFNLVTGEVLLFATCEIGGFSDSAACVCDENVVTRWSG